ncbi:MAG: hypothetical protein JJU36_04070 [Phycisphaeraceae bacterium]|nr:hypothetical protein [Phycisphaeraceae bacterium]
MTRINGRWTQTEGRFRNERRRSITIQPGEIELSDRAMQLQFSLTADEGQPTRASTRLTIQAEVPAIADADDPDWFAGGFWTVQAMVPQAHRPVRGTVGIRQDGQETTANITGRLLPVAGPGQWTSGQWIPGEGVAMGFDMGERRQNWNFARLAMLRFAEPKDISGFSQLRVEISTEQPRDDAAVSIWLREAEGGWYYIRNAVPLSRESNRVELHFEDFAEAEWVAPGNHMDADYTLDFSRISEMAIGVINPLGVGKVEFTLGAIYTFGAPFDKIERQPAQLRVSGRTLSINDHNVVPAAIFGGYAPDVPQEFRPGTQRYLHPSTQPRIPEQHRQLLNDDDVLDSAAIIARVIPGNDDQPPPSAAIAHLRSRLDERSMRDLSRLNPDQRAEDRGRRLVRDAFNRLMRQRELYDAQAMATVNLEEPARKLASRLAEGKLNDTEVMRLNRHLLVALFEGDLRPAPEHRRAEMYFIDCLGERKEPAYMLRNPNWERWFADWGRRFAENARNSGEKVAFQFWNEPYLNWAERSRVNFNTQFYDVENAGEDKPVRIRYPNGELGPEIPYFAWRRGNRGWEVYDTTAFSYWSGKGNGWIYDQMLGAIAPEIKKTHPEIILIAGWGFRWHEDHWAAWEMLYKPTIDQHIEWIDALDEHHYQGDTTAMNGSYEVATAYAMTEHGKWLYSANTETNDLVDAPARGAITTPEAARQAREYRRMVYNVRDLIYSIKQSPDKLLTRTVLHPTHTPQMMRVGYGMLTNLRGRLIEATTDDPGVWVVASVDGTDPKALPPGWTTEHGQELVVVVFNDHRFPREAKLTIDAPTGTRFDTGTIERNVVDMTTFEIDLERQENVKLDERTARFDIQLDARMAWKITIPLKGDIVEHDQVSRTQHFSPDILQWIRRDQPLETTITLPADKLATATAARLRIVVEEVAEGEAVVKIGEQRLVLPRAMTADNGNRIMELPLDLAGLKPQTPVRFELGDPGRPGYHVCMSSIVLEHHTTGSDRESGTPD